MTPYERLVKLEGPWFVRHTDDAHFMNMTVVSKTDRGELHDGRQYDGERDTVAITFHQLIPTVGDDSSEDTDSKDWDLGDNASLLISRAPDHALFAAAAMVGFVQIRQVGADYEMRVFDPIEDDLRDFDIGMDDFGCPMFCDKARNALLTALKWHHEQEQEDY